MAVTSKWWNHHDQRWATEIETYGVFTSRVRAEQCVLNLARHERIRDCRIVRAADTESGEV